MTSTALVGSTGLVGAQILSTLLTHPSISTIHTISRRAPITTDASAPSTKLHPHTSSETSTWSSTLQSLSPPPAIFFSALGTTKALAGSVANQRLIDHDLNLALARAAHAAGTAVYVLISATSANSGSMIPYSKMKGELEEAVKGLGFQTVVILQPGLLVGKREEGRGAEAVLQKVAGWMGAVGGFRATDFWAQDVNTIGRAAVQAGLEAAEGGRGKVWVVGQSEIVRLGRTEWKA